MGGGPEVALVVAMGQVGIASAAKGKPIGEKLQREQQRERAERLLLALDLERFVHRARERRARAGEDAQARRADLPERARRLHRALAGRTASAYKNRQRVAISRAYRTVQKFLDLQVLGIDEAGLLELERDLARGRIVGAAAENHDAAKVAEACSRLALARVVVKPPAHQVGNRRELGAQPLRLGVVAASLRANFEREREQERHRGGQALGMRRRLLLLGGEHQMVGLARAFVGPLPAYRGGQDASGLGLGDRARRVKLPS